MANLVFPQMSSGALAQYPLRRRRVIKGVVNVFADASASSSELNATSQTVWQLAYRDLNQADTSALITLFQATRGPLLPFIFIDPVRNLLENSSLLSAAGWKADPQLSIVPNAVDPSGGTSAFLLINQGSAPQSLQQTLIVPANFQYCFSIYAAAVSQTKLSLGWTDGGNQASRSDSFTLTPGWSRLVGSGKLNSSGMGLTVFLSVPPGQSLKLWGPQLEPQIAPSRYRASLTSGVYPEAYFLGDSLTFEASAPGLTSTLINIETE